MRRGARWLALAAALGLACELDGRGDLDLDAYEDSELERCAQLVHESLELGGELHAFLSDGTGPGGWGLISLVGENGPELVLVRVPGSEAELPTPPVELGLAPDYAPVTSLHAGTATGELWLFADGPVETTLVRAVPELGELVRNDLLANFPVSTPSGSCPTRYTRALLVTEGLPYILALPDCSEGPGLEFSLLALGPELLEFGQTWQLQFDPCADTDDPAGCALLLAYTLPDIGRARGTQFPAGTRAQAGFSQARTFSRLIPDGGGSESYDLALLDMRIDSEGPKARVITYREVWTGSTPTQLGPIAISEDPYATQLFVRNELVDDDAALLRFDTALGLYEQLRDPDLLPFAGLGQLIQLRDQGALVLADEAGLHAVALADLSTWGSWTTHDLLASPDLVAVEAAGVGHLLLRREQAAPQLLSIDLPLGAEACAPPPQQ